MIKLIKNELIKIFKRNSIYFLFLLSIVAIIIYNNINPEQNSKISYTSDTKDVPIAGMEQMLENVNKDNVEEYIMQLGSINFWKLYNSFEECSWQRYALKEEASGSMVYNVYTDYNLDIEEYLRVINDYENNPKTNITSELYEKTKEKYDKYIFALNSNNWKEYINLKIENLEERKKLEDLYEAEIEEINFEIEIYKLRLENSINFENNFLNQYIEAYRSNFYLYKAYETNEFNENEAFAKNSLNTYKTRMNLCKYAIEHNLNKDISNENGLIYNNKIDARISFIRTFKHFDLIIVIIAIYLATTIVTEEVNKNTIKNLLIKPQKRSSILISKIIACIISIIISMIFIIVVQYIVGGVVFGFDSYDLEYIGYDLVTNQIITMNLFNYVIIVGVLKLPMYILVIMFCICMGTMNNHTAMSMILTLIIFVVSSTIIAEFSKLEALSLVTRYFVTNNWDFSIYLFGQVSSINGVTFIGSIINCLIHGITLLYLSTKIFNKKEILNH